MADPVVQNLPATPDNLGQKTSAESFPVVLPSDYAIPVDTTGLATEAKQDAIIAEIDGVEESLDTLNAKDFATQTTLATVASYAARIPGSFLSGVTFDYATQTQNTTNDVWTFKTGGSGGTAVATITITYTDATKAVITSVART